MSYPWTRVPKGVPPLDGVQLRLLPFADLFMGLMWSRPHGLSLRTTWVTPATIVLSVGVATTAGLGGFFGLGFALRHGQVALAIAAVLAIAAGVGATSVAVYGIRQRRLARTA